MVHRAEKPPSHLDRTRTDLLREREELISRFAARVRAGNRQDTAQLFEVIQLTSEFLESLEHIATETRPKPPEGRNRYAASSLFLHECFRELTADSKEQLFFVTGSVIDGVQILTQRVEFEHQRRTLLGVTGDEAATHRALITLEAYGHRLLGHFHSHPGTGPAATVPSGTDEQFQHRLERAGHSAVAAIFSRDGCVRFFRTDQNLEISIYGKGVERLEPTVFRLTPADEVLRAADPGGQ